MKKKYIYADINTDACAQIPGCSLKELLLTLLFLSMLFFIAAEENIHWYVWD